MDFTGLAKSFDIPGERASTPAELRKALKRARSVTREGRPYLIDAIIGLSVAYKGFDNLKGFDKLFGESPDERSAVFIFGLFHGLGLATKLQDLGLSDDGLLPNLISFNLGVELGQLVALIIIVFALRLLPSRTERSSVGTVVNLGLVVAGFTLMAYQISLYLQT